MVGQGKRVESGGGSQGAGQVGGACQPCTLPQCGVRACRSNRPCLISEETEAQGSRSSSGSGRPGKDPPHHRPGQPGKSGRHGSGGGGAADLSLVNTVPSAGALGKAGSGAGREDPGSGLRRVTVTQPLGRPTPWNAVISIHARRSPASTWRLRGAVAALPSRTPLSLSPQTPGLPLGLQATSTHSSPLLKSPRSLASDRAASALAQHSTFVPHISQRPLRVG